MGITITLPPSSADRWSTCHASAALEKLYGIRKSSVYSVEGNNAHKVAAGAVTGNPVVFEDWLTADMVHYAGLYADFINSIRARGVVLHELVEQRLDTGRVLGTSKPSKGDVDFGCIVRTPEGKTELWVVDYKYGRGVAVSAYKNKQLLAYVLALVAEFGMPFNAIDKFFLCIHQPRIRDRPYIWESSYAEGISDGILSLRQGADATGATYQTIYHISVLPSVKGCRFCSVKARCKGLRMLVDDIFRSYDLENFNGDPSLLHGLVESTSPEELAALMDKLDIIDVLKSAVRERITDLVNAGEKVPGWGIGPNSLGNRKYINEPTVLRYLLKGVEEGTIPFDTVRSIPESPANMLKILKAKTHPDARAFIESQITRPEIPGKVQRVFDDPSAPEIEDIVSLLPD
jgi:Protein of unknown function (DUF2800)